MWLGAHTICWPCLTMAPVAMQMPLGHEDAMTRTLFA
jgi:hypothetical protein